MTGLSELLLTNVGKRVRITNELTDESFEGTLATDPLHKGKMVVRYDDDDIIPIFHDDEIELL